MASGIDINDKVKQVFREIKLKKCHKFVVLAIDVKNELMVQHASKDCEDFDTLRTLLGAASGNGECRYAILDHHDKIVLLCWSSDEKSTIKQKMLYASSFAAVQQALGEGFKVLTINDESDLNIGYIEGCMKSRSK